MAVATRRKWCRSGDRRHDTSAGRAVGRHADRDPRVAAIRILAIAILFPRLPSWSRDCRVVAHFNGNRTTALNIVWSPPAAGKVWRETTDQPLRLVGSYDNVLNRHGLLLSGSTIHFEIVTPALTPWTDEARIARQGILLYCPVAEINCMDALNSAPWRGVSGRRARWTLSHLSGIPGPVTRYAIVAVPPP